MLRIAVISLLVANLLLLGFQGDKPAAQPETIAKKAVLEDSGIPTIHLFSEMVQDQDLMSDSRQCFSLGPFHSDEDKNEVRALLQEVSASITERETQALVEKGYWVFMPPYESLLEANQVLLSIQALGLKDIAVIYNGEWTNAISLGYFLRQENALRRKKELENRGFAPKMRVQRQSETRYWLDFEQSPGSGLITMDMQDRPNDFMQRSLPCPDQNPFEITAGVSESPAVETEQPQTQLPEEETQPAVEENIESPPEEISEPQPEEVSEPPPEEISKPQPEEIIEPQPAEEDSSQQEDGDGVQPTEEIDIDSEESTDTTPVDNAEAEVPDPAIETEPENGLGAEPQNTDEAELEVLENPVDDTLQQQTETSEEEDGSQPIEDDGVDPEESIDSTPVDGDEAVTDQIILAEPENDPEAELQNSNEAEQEASENIVDDTLQQQVETPEESVPEEGDGLQAIEDDAINAAEIIDSTPVDGEKAVPGPVIETEPENSVETGPAIETELENSVETGPVIETEPENSVGAEPVIETESEYSVEAEPVIETEPENSVGTGPVIGFGTELEDSDENEAENSDEAGVEDSFGTESEDSDGTETDDG